MRLLVLTCAFLAASCASVIAEADFDPATDFGQYRTFALADPPAEAPRGLAWYSRLRGEELNRQLAAALTERGLVEAAFPEADLTFAFELLGEPRTDLRQVGSSWVVFGPAYGWHHGFHHSLHGGPGWHGTVAFGPAWYGPAPELYGVSYVVGTLVVEAHERASGELLWHAWSSARFDGDDAKENCAAMVKAIVGEWPGG